MEVDDDGAIDQALAGSNAGDVRYAGSAWSRHVEVPVERAFDGDRRPAATDAGVELITDLSFDPGKTGQTQTSSSIHAENVG